MAGWWQRIVDLWKSDENPDADFRVEDDETVEQILEYYETAIGVANAMIMTSTTWERGIRTSDGFSFT